MSRFMPRVDLWAAPAPFIARLQPGQHVTAGGAKGVFLGQGSGTIVVAWEGNGHPSRRAYIRALRTYAKGLQK